MTSQNRRGVLSLCVSALVVMPFGLAAPAHATDQSPPSQPRPFREPILRRDLGAVQRLIDAGADIDQRMFNRATPSITAAASDNWRIVLAFLDAGADASLENRMGLTVAELARTSRVVLDSDEGRALQRVRDILRARGLY
ncbi:hypothetical protein [Aliihoeflea sp. PC F10.4]